MEKKMNQQREVFIDFFRAICLLFVMLDHRSLLPTGIGVFVLTGFFIASGYTLKEDQGSFKTFIVKRIKRLMIPFWIGMVVMGCVEALRANLFHYNLPVNSAALLIPSILTGAYGGFTNFPVMGDFGNYLLQIVSYKPQNPNVLDMILPTNCHLWFLPALFAADVIMYGVFKLRDGKTSFDLVIIGLLLAFAEVESMPGCPQFPFGLGRGFYAASCMFAGYYMKKSGIFTKEKLDWQLILFAIASVPSVISIIYKFDGRGLVRSYYGSNGVVPSTFADIYITYICGVSFAYIVMLAMFYLSLIPKNPVSNFVAYAGMNSMDVYLWHFLVYFIGDVIMVYGLNAPINHNPYFVEIFEGTETLYRVLIVLIAYASLLGYAYIKSKIKTYFKEKKALALTK